MKILALDVSLHTGWALWSKGPRGEDLEFGVFDVPGTEIGERFHHFMDWLTDSIKNVNMIACEDTLAGYHVSRKQARLSMGFDCLIEMACFRRKIDLVKIAPTSLKKWATGSGKAEKVDMAEAAKARWKRATKPDLLLQMERIGWNSNAVDALLVLNWALHTHHADLCPMVSLNSKTDFTSISNDRLRQELDAGWAEGLIEDISEACSDRKAMERAVREILAKREKPEG